MSNKKHFLDIYVEMFKKMFQMKHLINVFLWIPKKRFQRFENKCLLNVFFESFIKYFIVNV